MWVFSLSCFSPHTGQIVANECDRLSTTCWLGGISALPFSNMINLCYNSLKKRKIFYSVSIRLMWAHAWMLCARRFEGVMMVQARSRYDSHAAVLKFAIPSLTKCWRAPRTCIHSWQPSSPESVLTSMRKSTLFRCLVSNGRIGLENWFQIFLSNAESGRIYSRQIYAFT